ncbi:MAG: class I SAM-dependent methyltransferase [Actinobacteria bacterium]|nr:class I SAM-dependent methyltransferase [Actinomycetota bacterium]MBM3697447.1 class I SAM-dependent methyltransferase [Actinomycetota bacterium]
MTLAIDIGSGASPLSGVLLGRGVDDVAVLDISASALAMARTSLGERAAHVQWIRADLRT